MAVRAGDIINAMERLAPPGLAEEWDNSGWQVGDPAAPVSKVLLALDITPEVVEEAENNGAQLIICHHPLFFKGIKSVCNDGRAGGLVYRLVRSGTCVYAAHTSLDSAAGGVNDALARALGLADTRVLKPAYGKLLKLVVFVPVEYAGRVREALGNAGAGWIGNYSHCTFNLRGTGTFYPREGTSPFIGSVGKLEQVEEVRIETIVRREDSERVVRAMLGAHPYEEVAYDLYPLENKGEPRGLGRLGVLPSAVSLAEFAGMVKKVLQAECVRYGGNSAARVERVAVCGGSGGDLWPLARQRGADVLVTGDVRYHAARDMLAAGINFIDAGHFATERVVLPALQEGLARALEKAGLDGVEITITRRERDAWVCI